MYDSQKHEPTPDMPTHFNKLTPAEAERLAMLAEEAAEVIQIVGKILRHGFESYHPDNPGNTNRDLLADEVCDFLAIVEMMGADFDVAGGIEPHHAIAKKLRYAHHQ